MADATHDRAAAIIDSMLAARGISMYDEFQWATREDPDFMETMTAFSNAHWSPTFKRVLDPKIKELIAIVILCYRGIDISLQAHMRRARQLGATKQEILEVLEAGVLPGGGPTMHVGLRALIEAENAGIFDDLD
jgi:AhpD family alkylhydroperoxidase